MRNLLFVSAAALCLSAVPLSDAGAKRGSAVQKMGKKGKKKKKGKGGKGGGGEGEADSCDRPWGVQAMVKGAGQRLDFTFAGKLITREAGTTGFFFLSFHPDAPGGETLAVTCKYNRFEDVSISLGQSRFRMSGRCHRVLTSGQSEWSDATHEVVINNGETDSIDIDLVGSGGISVPAGPLSFGNFAMSSQDDPPAAT